MAKKSKQNVIAPLKCYECGHAMEGRFENYRYTECGLNSVVLNNILVFHCGHCGARVPEIPATAALHARIAFDILFKKKTLLSGEEIRYLRTMAGFSAAKLADHVGVHKVTVSRWENGSKIGRNSDRVLRVTCFAQIAENLGINDSIPVSVVGETAQQMKCLDLPRIFEQIENRQEGSMKMHIDPNNLPGVHLSKPETPPVYAH